MKKRKAPQTYKFISKKRNGYIEGSALGIYNDKIHDVRNRLDLLIEDLVERYINAIHELSIEVVSQQAANTEPLTIELCKIELYPQWQRRGVGTAIVQALCTFVDIIGTHLKLYVSQAPEKRYLIAWYQKLGFQLRSKSRGAFLMVRKYNPIESDGD